MLFSWQLVSMVSSPLSVDSKGGLGHKIARKNSVYFYFLDRTCVQFSFAWISVVIISVNVLHFQQEPLQRKANINLNFDWQTSALQVPCELAIFDFCKNRITETKMKGLVRNFLCIRKEKCKFVLWTFTLFFCLYTIRKWVIYIESFLFL